MEEEPGVAIIKLVESYALGGPDEGTVLIYEVRPGPVPEGMNIEEFFLVTFDNHASEVAWGLGPTPDEALEVAMYQWSRYDYGNPFKMAYDERRSTGQKGEKDD